MNIGSIVTYDLYDKDEMYVITGMKNYEDIGSCFYARDYYIMHLEEIETRDYIKENEGIEIQVRGMKIPFTLVEDVAPFKIIKEVRCKVERMKPKTIIVYE